MRYQHQQPQRKGAAIVETAIVLTILVFVLLGLFVGGMAVSRAQLVTAQAHEAARYASVRGSDYERITEKTSPTKATIIAQTMAGYNGSVNADSFAVSIEWIDQGTGISYDWDSARKTVKSITASGEYITNTVRVTVTYSWATVIFGTQTFSHTTERPMAN